MYNFKLNKYYNTESIIHKLSAVLFVILWLVISIKKIVNKQN